MTSSSDRETSRVSSGAAVAIRNDSATGVRRRDARCHDGHRGRRRASDGPVADPGLAALDDRTRRVRRRVQAVRPGIDGRYTIAGLPPGRYLLAALTDIDENDWQDPAFLEQLVPVSIPIALAEGERKVQDLRVGR